MTKEVQDMEAKHLASDRSDISRAWVHDQVHNEHIRKPSQVVYENYCFSVKHCFNSQKMKIKFESSQNSVSDIYINHTFLATS